MPEGSLSPASQDWAVLFYLCGHFNRENERDPFVTALDELRAAGASPHMSAAAYLDLESGAHRVALRAGEPVETEFIGPVNSGAAETLEQFLAWAFDACPARRYMLVMAGLGIMDADSVVGRPPFDSTRTFAICDDRATGDALELHELGATLRMAFPPDDARRLVLLACDMYAMQFMEVAYELRGVVDFLVGIQPDDRDDAGALPHWPYARLMQRWQEVAARPASGPPRWKTGVDPTGLTLASETVTLLAEHYTRSGVAQPATVSAINLHALVPLAQALDTFSVVYLQWLSNDVIWRAREHVVESHQEVLEHSWSYDLDEVARAICAALDHAASEALVRWAASLLPTMPYAQLSRTLRVLGGSARDLARSGGGDVFRVLADEIQTCRSAIEHVISVAATESLEPGTPAAPPREVDQAVRRLFIAPGGKDEVREPQVWHAIIESARDRFTAVPARELWDAFDGIEAARRLRRLAQRVSDLTREVAPAQDPAIAAVWPREGRCGLALYRPLELDRLAESNYLHLRFSRDLHWTALLTAVDLIQHHARMLWRLVESQLTAAPLEARYQLMRRLVGDRALTGRHAGQLRVLSAPDAVFLTIQPDDETPGAAVPHETDAGDPIVSYCVRLSSLDRSTTVIERTNPVTRTRLERVLAELDGIGAEVDAPPEQTLERLCRCGSLLGDDILFGISEHLAEIQPSGDRDVHLVLQMPRDLMRYPWELLRDRHGWLMERFAIGRQIIAETDVASTWASSRRNGPLRLLVVAPAIEGEGAEIPGAGALEGARVASCFEQLEERLPGLVQPADFREFVDRKVTAEEFRALLRERRYDIVHFAGHGRYDPVHPERSCWLFTDGPLYAFELRHTLANAAVTPWLVYGSACEAAREGRAAGGYHDGVYGMASAALAQGVAAYIGPLWKISDTDAKNLAAAFYEALLLRRTSIGEALALARRSVRDGEPDIDDLVAALPRNGGRKPRSAGWTGLVLYGDPTPTVMQRLSPSELAEAAGVPAPEGAPAEVEFGVH